MFAIDAETPRSTHRQGEFLSSLLIASLVHHDARLPGSKQAETVHSEAPASDELFAS